MLKVKNLRKQYKDVTAVKDLSMEIQKGDIHGILGPNGAGKSTLMSCITGLISHDRGEITFENHASLKKWCKNIGYVPQELAIYPELSPYENVRFFASLYGFKGRNLERRVKDAINFVGLMAVKDKKSSQFSGGMKRRLNLACGIAHSPKLIIMDEPTVGIDPQSRNRILENVRELNRQGATIIYTTHYMEEVEAICNKITVIDKGVVIANGKLNELKAKIGNDIVFLITFDEEKGNKKEFMKKLSIISCIKSFEELSDDDKGSKDWSCKVKCEGEEVLNNILTTATLEHMMIKNVNREEMSLEEIFLSLTGKELRD